MGSLTKSASLTIEDKSFVDLVILVEVGLPKFAFKYDKPEPVFIGSCEWCN